jgi:hypothetical protein
MSVHKNREKSIGCFVSTNTWILRANWKWIGWGVFGHCPRLTRLVERRVMHAQLTTSRTWSFCKGSGFPGLISTRIVDKSSLNRIFGSLYFLVLDVVWLNTDKPNAKYHGVCLSFTNIKNCSFNPNFHHVF